ncbi:MAG: hypothetical protein HKO63_11480 [Acidimicrobiia bacterium]|nr:hypothetical protein [Acidimicrobiia bacterium]NNF55599.1 hypothetical protein [Acidimicrobiales bacterium]NNL98815.1 hypothetical protein [Acidimicrobiia bacterium]
MEVVGQHLARSDREGYRPVWAWGRIFFAWLFSAAAVSFVASAVGRDPGATLPNGDATATLVQRFALGKISAEEFTRQCAALRT